MANMKNIVQTPIMNMTVKTKVTATVVAVLTTIGAFMQSEGRSVKQKKKRNKKRKKKANWKNVK